MSVLGLESQARPSEIRIGFRSGWVRVFSITAGGAGLISVVYAMVTLAQRQPQQVFDLLTHWGVMWFLILVALLIAWDLAKLALNYLGRLADSVQQTAVAMNRIADKDDRERDRMVTETAFIGRRLERLAQQHQEWKEEIKDEIRGQYARIEQLLQTRPGER